MGLFGNLFLLFAISLAALIFLIGLTLIIYGLIRKNNAVKIGLIFAGISGGPFLIFFTYKFLIEILAPRPDDDDMVGIYRVSDVVNLKIDKARFHEYTLKFNKDRSYYLSPTPNIDICDSGRFHVEYKFMDDNHLEFTCERGYFLSARVDRHIGSYRIEFIVGDPDSGESIFFEKTDK